METAIKTEIPNVYFPFIVCEECEGETYINEDGKEEEIKRRYLVFETVEKYIKLMEKHRNCHEMIIAHSRNNKYIRTTGRLVFDFDIKKKSIPENFKQEMENIIKKTFTKHYKDVDINKLVFVWLNSENNKKISKHLIVKNAWFCEDWTRQIKEFYLVLGQEIKKDNLFDWIEYNELVDMAIAKNSSSLRMPLNSKLHGNPLLFENPNFSFYDGLVCLYRSEDKNIEQRISCSQFITQLHDIIQRPLNSSFSDIEIDEEYAEKAFDIFCKHDNSDSTFTLGKINGSCISLMRSKPSRCLISGSVHDSDNAILIIHPNSSIWFYCHRGCTHSGSLKCKRIDIPKKPPVHFTDKKIQKLLHSNW